MSLSAGRLCQRCALGSMRTHPHGLFLPSLSWGRYFLTAKDTCDHDSPSPTTRMAMVRPARSLFLALLLFVTSTYCRRYELLNQWLALRPWFRLVRTLTLRVLSPRCCSGGWLPRSCRRAAMATECSSHAPDVCRVDLARFCTDALETSCLTHGTHVRS